ncbi:hypothetical protein PCASD_07971 [Puccinia coronata f. sp. avenae]|uniref:CxC1-like cysteine cluster associated with KDZ transposases domain-containing protein n=1 Tax=Puccinia coronata f. sp. avenae TaxID=200324 RepID=A0A2N5UTI3_9BASI|nr:hypothetical protein PCASD_07971 [Puccinia coronata f. sp. avenae]
MRRFVLEAAIGCFKKVSNGRFLTEAPTGRFYEASSGWCLMGAHWTLCTASNAGLDGRIRFYIGCSHPIQTRAPGHRVNQEPIQTWWPNARATEFESVNDSLGGPAAERFEASMLCPEGAFEVSAGRFYQKASSGLTGFLETCPMVYWARSQRSSPHIADRTRPAIWRHVGSVVDVTQVDGDVFTFKWGFEKQACEERDRIEQHLHRDHYPTYATPIEGIENVSSGSDRLDVAPRDHSTCKKSPLTTGAAIISALIQCRPAYNSPHSYTTPTTHHRCNHHLRPHPAPSRRATRQHAIAGYNSQPSFERNHDTENSDQHQSSLQQNYQPTPPVSTRIKTFSTPFSQIPKWFPKAINSIVLPDYHPMHEGNSADFAEDYASHVGGYDGPLYWVDVETIFDEESNRSLAQIRSLYQQLKQNHKQNNWIDLFKSLFPAYTHLKRITNDWTLPDSLDDRSHEVCNCSNPNPVVRQVDLIDLLGQKRVPFCFCHCTPDPVQLLAHGYLPSTPVYPQTAFSLRLLKFYHLLWNLCNAATTPFAEVMRRWNESLSIRLCSKSKKNLNQPRRLGRNLSGSIEVYRMLLAKHSTTIQTFTSATQQDVLAQRSCPACFGLALPDPSQPPDTRDIFICLDGNFQHRHHERASKNHLPLQIPDLFLDPSEISAADAYILRQEQAQKKTQTQKDHCSTQHKAADDKRNASTWKGCDDTGLMGTCCRHDSLIYYCNINRAGEGRGLPVAILTRLYKDINPNVNLRVLYDIGCSLEKFISLRKMFPEDIHRTKFATSIFHSYVHEWECQLKYNPRYNVGWGMSDGEGLERLWSYLSALVSPLRYATRNHRLNSLHHRSIFHNAIVCTLRRKFIHAFAHRKHNQDLLDKLSAEANKHIQPQSNFSADFFKLQWQLQTTFESQKHTDKEVQKKLADFFERGELLKDSANTFVATLACQDSDTDQSHTINILQQIRDLQSAQDAEAAEIGGEFGDLDPANKEQQRMKILLWSAKSALFKAAVELQAETQPLRASKDRGERLGTRLKEKIYAAIKRRKKGVVKAIQTFCKRRTAYLKAYAPAELELNENQDFDYNDFMKMGLEHPFWNDGYLCLSRDPWAVDPVVRTGIHAVLGLERSSEEVQQLQSELRRALSWALIHLQNLKDCINKTVEGDKSLDEKLDSLYGDISLPGVQNRPGGRYLLLGGDLFLEQLEHEQLLCNWHHTIQGMLEKRLICQEMLPIEWFTTINQLMIKETAVAEGDGSIALNVALEEVALDDQDSDGGNNEGPTEDDFVTDDEGI